MSIGQEGIVAAMNLGEMKKIFASHPHIAAAYLFGSTVSGKAGPMSDMDIGILLGNNAPRGRELIQDQNYLAYELGKTLGVDDVDVIVLNGLGPLFQHNVLRTGRLIYEADKGLRVRFVAGVITKICDFEPTRRIIEAYQFQGWTKRVRAYGSEGRRDKDQYRS